MKVATLERIRNEKNRDAARYRSTFFARGNQPLMKPQKHGCQI
jgi:hypothetical protein